MKKKNADGVCMEQSDFMKSFGLELQPDPKTMKNPRYSSITGALFVICLNNI
jgi:hypothetical protein